MQKWVCCKEIGEGDLQGYFVEEWVCQGEMGERESLEVFCKGMSVLKEKWKKGI